MGAQGGAAAAPGGGREGRPGRAAGAVSRLTAWRDAPRCGRASAPLPASRFPLPCSLPPPPAGGGGDDARPARAVRGVRPQPCPPACPGPPTCGRWRPACWPCSRGPRSCTGTTGLTLAYLKYLLSLEN